MNKYRLAFRNPLNGNSHSVNVNMDCFNWSFESVVSQFSNRESLQYFIFLAENEFGSHVIAESFKHSRFESVFCSGGSAKQAQTYAESGILSDEVKKIISN